jgi:membrane protein implicated in regulation of membrane protease activity
MRKRASAADLAFQFISFAGVCVLLSLARWPFPVKIVLAFAFSLLLSWGYSYVRRVLRRRGQQPKKLRVIHIENAED